jgi:hypothetical protein
LANSALFYAVQPGYVQLSGQVPPTAKPGAQIHFNAALSGTSFAAAHSACSNDLSQLDFDIAVE